MGTKGFTQINVWDRSERLFNRLWRHEGGAEAGLKKSAYFHRLMMDELKRQELLASDAEAVSA